MLELRPWTDAAFDILVRANTPEMTEQLGGPESPEKLLDRHQRYLALTRSGAAWPMQLVVDDVPVGSFGYWQHDDWFEAGWAVLPEFQGRGYAKAGVLALLQHAKANGSHERLHAVTRVTNTASNAIASSLGFTLLNTAPMEYPAGHFSLSNVWAFELRQLS